LWRLIFRGIGAISARIEREIRDRSNAWRLLICIHSELSGLIVLGAIGAVIARERQFVKTAKN
jgi:hypothetical protein